RRLSFPTRRSSDLAHWLDPGNPAFAAEVGGALELQGAYSDAASWYRMAVELAPDDPSWYALLARYYVESGYLPDAADYAFVEEAAARFPDHPDLAVSYGWALYLQGDHADRKSTRLNSSHVKISY